MEDKANLRILADRRKIGETVERLALEITRDYEDKTPVLVGILKGSVIFLADLIRKLDFPLEIDFVGCMSYGNGQHSSGRVEMTSNLRCDVSGRHVLLVEDIVDTGITIDYLLEYLKSRSPASLKLCALLDKPAGRHSAVNIDYAGMAVPDKFIVGYGLDYAEKYRNLPDICYLEN